MRYRCEALSLEGFIQQIAVNYVPHGYWFYVTGRLRPGRDWRAVDARIVAKYGIALSPWQRARRKRAGAASLQYIRFEEFFVILATEGRHAFHAEERAAIRDLRETPLKFAGYSVSRRGGHAHVRIEQQTYQDLKAWLTGCAARKSKAALELAFYRLPFEPYAPVRRQFFALLRAVNERRRAAGLAPLSDKCLPLRRRIYRPFDSPLPRGWGPAA
jgi:hypothetical protein